jgi:hypothetical protein
MPILDKPLREDIGKKSLLHAVLFPKDKYSIKQSREWLKSHNYTVIHNRDTKNIHRFRIREQIKGYNFYTIKLNNGIEMVYMSKP